MIADAKCPKCGSDGTDFCSRNGHWLVADQPCPLEHLSLDEAESSVTAAPLKKRWSRAGEAASEMAKHDATLIVVAASMATQNPDDANAYANMLESDLPANLDHFAKDQVQAEQGRLYESISHYMDCGAADCERCTKFRKEVQDWENG